MSEEEEHASLAALRVCVFGFLLIEISSRKAVPEVTSTFPGPLREMRNFTAKSQALALTQKGQRLSYGGATEGLGNEPLTSTLGSWQCARSQQQWQSHLGASL